MKDLKILIEKKFGKYDDLEKEISSENIQELELVGYISTGMTKECIKYWKATSKAKKDYNIFCSTPNFGEKILGVFMYYIGLKTNI